ncbi:18010_t:CDS:2, partial [Racocetra persica]
APTKATSPRQYLQGSTITKKYHDKKIKPEEFKIEDQVLLYESAKENIYTTNFRKEGNEEHSKYELVKEIL